MTEHVLDNVKCGSTYCDVVVFQGTMYGVMRKLETAVGAENIKTSDPVNFIQQV